MGKLGRLPILINGMVTITVALFLFGLCVLKEWHKTSFILMIVLIFCFHFSIGCVTWVYISKVCVDVASGFVMTGQGIFIALNSMTFEFMINSTLKVYGTIWFYGVVTFLGFIYFYIFMKETRFLTDREKKSLYSPKN